jgi:hypothetical protein
VLVKAGLLRFGSADGCRWLSALLALGVMCVLALAVGVARAEPPKLVLFGSFNAKTALPIGVAVDQSSGDVYVAGLLDKESLGGVPVSKFDASGGSLEPSFGSGIHSGAAVDPVNGDVYVLSNAIIFFGAPVIATYDPSTGEQVGTPFAVPASDNLEGAFTAVEIAADSSGNVYVPVVPENKVVEYSPTGTELKAFTGGTGIGALKEPTGVAVDPSGDVWVADNGDSRIEELSPAGVPMGEVTSKGVESVALDGHGGVLLAMVRNNADFCGEVRSPCQHLVVYDSTGVQVGDVGAGSFGNQEEGSATVGGMVAADGSTGRVYVADPLKGLTWMFGPPSPPVLGKELSAEVTTGEAKLGALVNPGGIPTSYRFEYGTSSAYGQSTPYPEGSVGEGLSSRTVWAAASGLAPGTTYHYRVVASNELGTVHGPDQTFTTLTAAQAACPNSELRGGFAVRLPDCRSYELVTVPPKDSSQLWSAGPVAANGEAFAFFTAEPLPGSPTSGLYYLVRRGPGGWSEEDVMPLESYTGILCTSEAEQVEWSSAEMSKTIIGYGKDTRASKVGPGSESESCNADGLQVVPGEPVGYKNLLVRDNTTGTFRLVNAPPTGVMPADAHFQGASPDLSHVFFTEMGPLAPGASYGVENLFEWDEGTLRLLTVLPDGKPVVGSLAGEPGTLAREKEISVDGSHVLFTSGGGLYDRIDGERTVQVDETQGSGPSGGGSLQAASTDGSEIFFLDASRLTSQSTAQTGEPDLYECVLPESAAKCQLSDLTSLKAGEHADVLKVMIGNQDSSHVYFTATGVLATNKREYEYTDNEGKSHKAVEEAVSGQDNLYLEQAGSIKFIATVSSNEGLVGVASPDGAWFAFESKKSLTGYDNSVPGGGLATEIFLYDSATGRVECASCNPSGEAPVAGGVPTTDNLSLGSPLSDGGRLFFETAEALVPSDTNGGMDVYEYEGGQASLISSGTSAEFRGNAGISSLFVGASESGDDVFFGAAQQLVPQDTNEDSVVVYDARVDGGFPVIASPPACVTADACRSAVSPQPSIYGAPSSQTFSGEGNLTLTAEAKPKKKAKPKRKKPKRVCPKGKHKRARCSSQAARQGIAGKAKKSHKGGK